jgi:hypothetical protein
MLYRFDIPVTGLRQINLISEIQLATMNRRTAALLHC